MRPAGTREYKNYAECKDVSLYSAGVESFRAERGSGSDKRSVSDSLYDDVQHLGFRGVRGDRFLTYPNRAGSLETCGFKQRFWSLLGLRPKATRASEGGSHRRPCGSGGRVPVPRRGRRSRRPVSIFFHATGGPISFSSERNGGKNAAKNQWFLDFLCPI